MRRTKVLAPIDGSEFSLLILHYIHQFLTPERYEVILFCVKEEPVPPHNSRTTLVQARAAVTADVLAELAPHQQVLQDAGFIVSTEVAFGDPIPAIDQFLERSQPDLIAMTTHGRSGLRRALMGSVAQHLLQHGALPILLYRPFDYT